MRVRFLSILLLLSAIGADVACGEPVSTRTLRVTLTASGEGTSTLTGTVTLRAVMGPQPPIEKTVGSLAEPLTFSVPPRTMWTVGVQLPGWWAAPVVVEVRDEDIQLTVPLLPTGLVTGRLVTPAAGTKPESLSVTLDVPPGARKLPGPPHAETPCSLTQDTQFSCEVPAGTLDLSFRPKGYVPIYRWGVKVAPAARKDVGAFALLEGSAVSGFVTLSRSKLEAEKGKVELFVEAAGTGANASRLRRPVARATVAKNGFFQVTEVPPGRYMLEASYPGFAEAVVAPLHVYARVETKLRRTIELQPPATLTLRVQPAVDHGGKEWIFRVRRASPVSNRYDAVPVFEGAGTGGAVVLREQPGGRYSVVIADAAGNPFVAQELTTAGAGDETHDFQIDFVKVKGTLRRGENPLAAAIWFGGRFGDKHVALRSNEDGEFQGVLPHAGLWRVSINTDTIDTVVNAKVPKADDENESEVDLTIPSNHVEGVVIDGAGKPLRLAVVRFNTDSDFAIVDQTDASGHFAFDGVAPGPFTLIATHGTGSTLKSSPPYSATLGESDSLDAVVLKVQDGRLVHGRVLSPDGPVIGADVSIFPTGGTENPPQTNATTGLDGTFEVSVAEGFDRAFMTVQAPGYALRVFDVPIDGRAVTLHVQPAGGTLRVTVAEDANGVFVFQDDRFLSLTSLVQWASRQGEPFLNGQTVRVGDLAPARYRACTMKPGRGSMAAMTRCTEGFLPPYGELHLTIE